MFENQPSRSSSTVPSHLESCQGLLPSERADLRYLEEFVKPLYQPSEQPLIMVVGASALREATIVREFHSKGYNVPPGLPFVVGCNLSTAVVRDSYNQMRLGVMRGDAQVMHGDALQIETWLMPLSECSSSSGYDMTYIRNPDLINLSKWTKIYHRAFQHTKSSGVVVSFIRNLDTAKCMILLNVLQGEGIEPILIKQALEPAEGDSLDQHSNLIVFRGAGKSS